MGLEQPDSPDPGGWFAWAKSAIDALLAEVYMLKPLAEIGATLNQLDPWIDVTLTHEAQQMDSPPHWVVVRCWPSAECDYTAATIREALAKAGLMGKEHNVSKVQEARDNARLPDSPIGRRIDR